MSDDGRMRLRIGHLEAATYTNVERLAAWLAVRIGAPFPPTPENVFRVLQAVDYAELW